MVVPPFYGYINFCLMMEPSCSPLFSHCVCENQILFFIYYFVYLECFLPYFFLSNPDSTSGSRRTTFASVLFIPYFYPQPKASYPPAASTLSHLSYGMTYIVEFTVTSHCDFSLPRLPARWRTRVISGSWPLQLIVASPVCSIAQKHCSECFPGNRCLGNF